MKFLIFSSVNNDIKIELIFKKGQQPKLSEVIEKLSNEEILNIIETFGEDLKLYLYLCGFDLCGRMENFNLEEGKNKFKT